MRKLILFLTLALLSIQSVNAEYELIFVSNYSIAPIIADIGALAFNNYTNSIWISNLSGGTPVGATNFSLSTMTRVGTITFAGGCSGSGGQVGLGINGSGIFFNTRENDQMCEYDQNGNFVQTISPTFSESGCTNNIQLDFAWNYSAYASVFGGSGCSNATYEYTINGATVQPTAKGFAFNVTKGFTFSANNGNNFECIRMWFGTYCNVRNVNETSIDYVYFFNESRSPKWNYRIAGGDGVGITTNMTDKNDRCCIFVQNASSQARRLLMFRVNLSNPIDATPPTISYYNLTNEDGCESWITNPNTACYTSDTTPTIKITTSEAASCKVAGGSSSTSFNINYTQMTSLRNCSTGEWTTELRCSLANEDELVYDTSYLFISCTDASGNMNRSGTSTSGPLKVSVTGLEAAGRTAIGIGVQNALGSGYVNYTDQQIYARSPANNHSKGTFDWVAEKSNKDWLINRIGVSDSHVRMFNLTPSLYVLELANKTSANITKQVELLINATK